MRSTLTASMARSSFATHLSAVPRSAQWILPTFASAFVGVDVSTLEPKVRALVLLRIASIDHAPYWRQQLEACAPELGITPDQLLVVATDEWDDVPAFSPRERAAIRWGERVARRTARRDRAAYEEVMAQFDEQELVELTLVASLACMADRVTNALRISPEPATDLSPSAEPLTDADLVGWSRSIARGVTFEAGGEAP